MTTPNPAGQTPNQIAAATGNVPVTAPPVAPVGGYSGSRAIYNTPSDLGAPSASPSVAGTTAPSAGSSETTGPTNTSTPDATPDITSASPNRTVYTDPNAPAYIAPQSQDEIQASALAAAQGQIDSLNKYSADLSATQQDTNDENMRETNAIETLNGNSGSTEAAGAAAKTRKTGDAALKTIADANETQVQGILSDIRKSSIDQAQTSLENSRQSVQDRAAYADKAKTDATTQLANLMKMAPGTTLDGLKATLSPDEYNYLVGSVGGEDQAKAILFENRPKDTVLGTPQLIGDKMVQAYTAPDGTVKYENIALPDGVKPDNIKSITSDASGIYIIKNDGTYSRISGSGTAKTAAGPGTPYVPGADPTVDAWVQNINSGKAKLSDITSDPALKSKVAIGLSQAAGSGTDILATTQQSLKELQDMVDSNHGFHSAVGFPSLTQNPINTIGAVIGLHGNPAAGTGAADFDAKLNQVKNDVIIPNLTLLHGLGRVTDREFQALSSAITSLSPNLSEEQFKTELKSISDQIDAKAAVANSSTTNNISSDGGALEPDSNPDTGTTLLTGPDGKPYNVPNDQVAAFKAAGGH